MPGVRVVTAPNAGAMTFTGTRTYLLGIEDIAVIDPGPDLPQHREAILRATAGARVTGIFVTHAHLDHSALARRLSRDLDAAIFGFGDMSRGLDPRIARLSRNCDLGGGEGIDHRHRVDVELGDGESVRSRDWVLDVLHTPGHLADHLCLAWPDAGVVFTGDHVMAWATTMVSPPDGDMRAFIRSLERMSKRRDDRLYFPGHGGAVEDPGAMIAYQLRHRLRREAQILEALASGGARPGTLVRRIYADLDARLHPAAERNVLAHLVDLADRGVVFGHGPDGPNCLYRLAAEA